MKMSPISRSQPSHLPTKMERSSKCFKREDFSSRKRSGKTFTNSTSRFLNSSKTRITLIRFRHLAQHSLLSEEKRESNVLLYTTMTMSELEKKSFLDQSVEQTLSLKKLLNLPISFGRTECSAKRKEQLKSQLCTSSS